MSFNSLFFVIFFGIIFLLYWRIPQKYRWAFLLAASYYFYVSWQLVYGLILLLMTVVSFYAAIAIQKFPKKKQQTLTAALFIQFGILFLFKYLNFFDFSLNQLLRTLHVQFTVPEFKLLLPIGISFYTFQTAGYLIDVYRGKIKAEKHFGIFALFVSFFPQIVAGPIGRSTQLLPQFRQKQVFDYERVVSGLQLFTLGLFKKMVIADNLGLVVDKVFQTLPQYKGLSLLITMFFFSWQIYADFSGYTDMARGVARTLGFDLLENFRTPYLATSVQDFWRRWHISLSTWFKDYLYIPLGGSRKGIWRTCLNTLIVFVICGLWHGASWNFVVWGFMHGILMSVERVYRHIMQITKRSVHFPKFLSIAYTYSFVLASWVFFRAPNFNDAVYIFRYAFAGTKHFVLPSYIWASFSQMFRTNLVEIGLTLFCVGAIISIDLLSTKISLAQVLRRQPLVIRWSFYIAAVSLIVLLRNAAMTKFIYVQF